MDTHDEGAAGPRQSAAEGNDQLRRARLARRSPARPHRALSRAELASAAAAFVLERFGHGAALDANYIGKLERGVVRWPSLEYRVALRHVLEVASDAGLGFWPAHPMSGDRPTLPADSPTVEQPAWPALDHAPALDRMTPTPVPDRVSRTEIGQLEWAAKAFAEWDNRYGGLAREAPMAQLRWSVELLRTASCPSDLRADLLSAVAYLAHTCGFMAFDAHAFGDARRVLRFGLACAEEAVDWHIRSRLHATLARLETWVGRADHGLTHTQLALVRGDRLTATEHAMLRTLEARSLAAMGQGHDVHRAIGQADDAFAERDPDADPAWMAYYDDAQHAGDLGVALLDLVAAGAAPAADGDAARARFRCAVDARPSHLARSRALSQANLAKLEMLCGEPSAAALLGHHALDTAGPIRSKRVARDLAQLGQYAARHAHRSDVDELIERIRRPAPT